MNQEGGDIFAKDHFETEELVSNFKLDYEDTKKMLEEKLAESKEAENNHRIAIEGFNEKLEELQKIIDNLKHIIIEKDITIKKLQRKLDLQQKSSKEELFIRDVSTLKPYSYLGNN